MRKHKSNNNSKVKKVNHKIWYHNDKEFKKKMDGFGHKAGDHIQMSDRSYVIDFNGSYRRNTITVKGK